MAPMRRIVTFDWLTADGYFAGRDRNLDWVVPDDEQARAAAGSAAVDDSATAADPHRPGQRSKEHRAIAIWLNEATKLVFCRSSVVCPVLLGSGRPLLGEVPTSVRLDLREATRYPSGDVLLRYARVM
jgi:hypothetical protein